MKKTRLSQFFFMTSLAVLSAVVVAGCSASQSPAADQPVTQEGVGGVAPAADQKQGTTTKSGQIVSLGGGYYLQAPGKTPELIESYNLDLSQYVGQTVTVSGQFSGDTLFVSQVQ